MNLHIRFLVHFILAMALPALAQTNVLGTVLDARSEMPVPRARAFGSDSAFLGSSDAQGRFELRLVRPQEITFRKEGYKDQVVTLSQVTNLLDLSVSMEPMGIQFQERVVSGTGVRRSNPTGTISGIEEMSGMRFDLQEHLKVLPGVSGISEFSSDVSIYGSRSADVSHVLGAFPIPNMRHLDYSFPGNQSVLNPRMLQSIQIEHDPVSGPLEQGLASALRYVPRRPSTERHEFIGGLGLTNRELDALGPIGNGTYATSFRWLDPSLMTHLSDRFFAGPRTFDQRKNVVAEGTSFKLEAFDGYGRVEQGVDDWAVSFTALGTSDDHKVEVLSDLQTRSPTSGETSTPSRYSISRGQNTTWLAFAQAEGEAFGGFTQFYGGRVQETENLTLGDTARKFSCNGVGGKCENDLGVSSSWAAVDNQKTDDRFGGSFRPNRSLLGGEPEVLAAVHRIVDERKSGQYREPNGSLSSVAGWMRGNQSFDYLRVRSAARLRWREGQQEWGVSVGNLWVQGEGSGMEYTGSFKIPYWGVGWTGNLSTRRMERAEAVRPGELGIATSDGFEAKLGAGKKVGPIELTGAVYHRSVDNPALPRPEVWWVFPQRTSAKDATVYGGTLQATWAGIHWVQILSNISRVQGEYSLANGAKLDWEANRDFEVQTLIKFHPRRDTLFRVILAHTASLGKPTYSYSVDSVSRTMSIGTDAQAIAHPSLRDAFRTDLRLEVDLPVALPPIKGLRFYLEGQNLFSQFDGEWAKPLGSDNFRQRSWQPDKKGVNLQPFYAAGTGLFFSFGVEGSFAL